MSSSERDRLISEVAEDVAALRDLLVDAEARARVQIDSCHERHRRSASNLVHYVALRGQDLRQLQTRLAELGLSSLGRAEASVLGTVETVLDVLHRLQGLETMTRHACVGIQEGSTMLAGNAEHLLGALPPGRSTRIMVTLPSEAASDSSLVHSLRQAGMDVARINCAHDDLQSWTRMAVAARAPLKGVGRPCLVAVDVAGPKLRTGPMELGPGVVRLRPEHDPAGHVVRPGRARLVAHIPLATVQSTDLPVLPVADGEWVRRRFVGERIHLDDARDAHRTLTVVANDADACIVETKKSVYLTDGIELAAGQHDRDVTEIVSVPPAERAHRVAVGDLVILTRSLVPAEATGPGTDHRIGCTLEAVFEHARDGERVFIDDGKIGGRVEWVKADEIGVVITDVKPGGANLRGGKGINLPDTDLQLSALTDKDLADLDFVAESADMVDFSFVRRPEDVLQLQRELEERGGEAVGLVLKIENAAAFEALPELLLTAMRSERVGVMIARGDLAVEVGFERLAEVQEEILWACEAAHIPVIWATQVLDTMARTGLPSRAEITDAAMAERAECVMLNKGPHILDAMRALDSIASRMQHHQQKKRSLLRRLTAWDHTP